MSWSDTDDTTDNFLDTIDAGKGYLLQENGYYILQENGAKILLQPDPDSNWSNESSASGSWSDA